MDIKLPYEKEPPAMYYTECSLPKRIFPVLRELLCDDLKQEVVERCLYCWSHNINPRTSAECGAIL